MFSLDNKCKQGTAVALAAMLVAGAAHAAPDVAGRLQAFNVSFDDAGTERVEPATATEPGATMEYRLTFTNAGDTPVNGLEIVDPIPENTTFVTDSASSQASAIFEVSIDGGRSFEAEPVRRVETRPDGSQQDVIIPPSRYTHLRWSVVETLDADGGTQQYAYRVLVD